MIDRDKYPNCIPNPETGIVPDGPNYGDGIGTKNNQLRIGDVA